MKRYILFFSLIIQFVSGQKVFGVEETKQEAQVLTVGESETFSDLQKRHRSRLIAFFASMAPTMAVVNEAVNYIAPATEIYKFATGKTTELDLDLRALPGFQATINKIVIYWQDDSPTFFDEIREQMVEAIKTALIAVNEKVPLALIETNIGTDFYQPFNHQFAESLANIAYYMTISIGDHIIAQNSHLPPSIKNKLINFLLGEGGVFTICMKVVLGLSGIPTGTETMSIAQRAQGFIPTSQINIDATGLHISSYREASHLSYILSLANPVTLISTTSRGAYRILQENGFERTVAAADFCSDKIMKMNSKAFDVVAPTAFKKTIRTLAAHRRAQFRDYLRANPNWLWILIKRNIPPADMNVREAQLTMNCLYECLPLVTGGEKVTAKNIIRNVGKNSAKSIENGLAYLFNKEQYTSTIRYATFYEHLGSSMLLAAGNWDKLLIAGGVVAATLYATDHLPGFTYSIAKTVGFTVAAKAVKFGWQYTGLSGISSLFTPTSQTVTAPATEIAEGQSVIFDNLPAELGHIADKEEEADLEQQMQALAVENNTPH